MAKSILPWIPAIPLNGLMYFPRNSAMSSRRTPVILISPITSTSGAILIFDKSSVSGAPLNVPLRVSAPSLSFGSVLNFSISASSITSSTSRSGCLYRTVTFLMPISFALNIHGIFSPSSSTTSEDLSTLSSSSGGIL